MPARKRSSKESTVREVGAPSYVANPPLIEIGAGAFKDQCLRLLEQVRAGEAELLVTKHGVPVARVVAPDATTGTSRGFMRGTVLSHKDIVSADHDAWGDSSK